MADRDVTKCRKLVEKIKPLADWLKVNRPSTKNIAVYKGDWLYLIKAPPDVIRTHGFSITKENGITYDGFTLRPTVQKVNKG